MINRDGLHDEPRSRDREDLSGSLLRAMAAAADETSKIEGSGDSAALAIEQCAALLSRFWPVPAEMPSDEKSCGGGSVCDSVQGASDVAECLETHRADEEISPPQQLGRFEIRRVLGHGGFGVVFLVFDPRLNREAALKLARPEILASPALRNRFIREAQASAVLDHPNIVPIFETGEVGPVGYILSAYCKGPTLAAWLRDQSRPVASKTAAAIVEKLADAVHHAHSRGILHRDIKPSNVLLEQVAEGNRSSLPFVARLTDFGLAKRLGEASQDTQGGMILGTPRYMAPEQAAGDDRAVGVHTDVYGLGAILYELLTGEAPFVGSSDGDTLLKIRETELSPAVLRRHRVPRDLETICLKCLEKNPPSRYQTACNLAEDLRRFLAGEPVTARPVGSVRRLARWSGRRPLVAGLLISLAVSILAGIAAAGWEWMRAEQHLEESIAAAERADQNLAQAEQTLLDLTWMVEESSLWGQETSQFREAIHEKLKRYHESISQQGVPNARWTPMIAAIHSFAARNAALTDDFVTADKDYRLALDAWCQAVGEHPERVEYRRALGLCMLSYSQLLRSSAQKQGQGDGSGVLRDFYANIAVDPKFGNTFLSDFVELMYDRGTSAKGRPNRRDALEVGLIAAQVLDEKTPGDVATQLWIGKLWRTIAGVEVAMRDAPRARESLMHAMAIFDSLRTRQPENTVYVAESAEICHQQGLMAGRVSDHKLVVEKMEKSIDLDEQLARTRSAIDSNRLRMAISLRQLGYSLLELERLRDATHVLKQHGSVVDEMEKRHEPLPARELKRFAVTVYRAGVGWKNFGDQEAATAAFMTAAKSFKAAEARGATLTAADRVFHAECYYFTAGYRTSLGDTQGAIQNHEAVVRLLREYTEKRRVNPIVKDYYDKSQAAIKQLQSKSASVSQTN